MFTIYWLINERMDKSYIGYTPRLRERLNEHKRGLVKSTKDFGDFKVFKLENVAGLQEALKREKYWKSAAGRKKLKKYFEKIKNNYPGPFV